MQLLVIVLPLALLVDVAWVFPYFADRRLVRLIVLAAFPTCTINEAR